MEILKQINLLFSYIYFSYVVEDWALPINQPEARFSRLLHVLANLTLPTMMRLIQKRKMNGCTVLYDTAEIYSAFLPIG